MMSAAQTSDALRTRAADQRGMVSFMVTLIMMLVISLIVIGFSQVTNRSRREALDRQLGNQALYAAESGINDAVSIIRNTVASGSSVTPQSSCNPSGSPYNTNAVLSTEPAVSISCVLVNPLTPNLVVSANSQASSVVFLSTAQADGSNGSIDSLKFTWSVASGGNADPSSCPSLGTFPKSADYACGYGLLHIDLYELSGIPTNADVMDATTVSIYAQPVSGGGGWSGPSIGATGMNKVYRVGATCSSSSQTCSVEIPFDGAARTTAHYARLSTLYRDSPRVSIDGNLSSAGTNSAFFKDSQVIVDVTGKASDVLKRIQVRLPLRDYGGTSTPTTALTSGGDVCKRFAVSNGYYASSCP